MKYQKMVLWTLFLPKKHCFSHPPQLYPPACTHRAHLCWDDAPRRGPAALIRAGLELCQSSPRPDAGASHGSRLEAPQDLRPEPCHAARQSYLNTRSWRWTSSNDAPASTRIPSSPPINLSSFPSLRQPPSPFIRSFIRSTARRDSESTTQGYPTATACNEGQLAEVSWDAHRLPVTHPPHVLSRAFQI
jgi:hypothetical protein